MSAVARAVLVALLGGACTPSGSPGGANRPAEAIGPVPAALAGSPVVVEQLVHSAGSAGVRQIPPTSAAIGEASPETELAPRVQRTTDNDAVYRDVVTAWQAIRARGQQPSAELLAQAVGPERLAAFLSLFPDRADLLRGGTGVPPATPPDPQPAPRPESGKP